MKRFSFNDDDNPQNDQDRLEGFEGLSEDYDSPDDDDYEQEDSEEYTEDQLKRYQRYQQMQDKKRSFLGRLSNPFGLRDKFDDMEDRINNGSSHNRLVFTIGALVGFTVLIVVMFFVVRLVF